MKEKNSEPNQIQSVLVVGGGSAGFLSALCLKRTLPELDVALVHSPDIPVIGVGESTTAHVPEFLHASLQLDETEFLRETGSSLKLGIKYLWGDARIPHFNYTFDGGTEIQKPGMRKWSAFHALSDFSDASFFSAFMDRDHAPCIKRPNGNILFRRGWAYHIDNVRFLSYLEKLANKMGVRIISGNVVDVIQKDDGALSGLRLEDSRVLEADLFVDCTGFRSLLLGKTLTEPYISYNDTLWCDTAVVGSWRRDDEILPYTTAETMDNGWCWRIDFRDHVTRGYVFSSRFCSADQAAQELQSKNPLISGDLRTIRFKSGRYENFWVKNVVAVGNASGFVEPLEATALHLLTVQIWAVANSLRETGGFALDEVRKLHNQRYQVKWDDVRDFLALHYKFNFHSDSPFWHQVREEISLHGASELVEFYRQAGPSRLCDRFVPSGSMFGTSGYLSMLVGQRVSTINKGDLSKVEQVVWERYRNSIRQNMAAAIGMREALDVLYTQPTTPA